MVVLEEVQGGQSSRTCSIEVESMVGWLGSRISSCCGTQISEGETQKLNEIVHKRMAMLSLHDPVHYFQLVDSQSNAGKAEWEQLLSLFMNGETFFFRDSGQFSLLKEHILPTLIHRQKAARSLRILSAGCSTGEEAYSLAILVDQLLPHHQDWEVEILGIDINVRSLEHAQRGEYGRWAFRKIDSELQQQYFQQQDRHWVLNESIRTMVRFQQVNLFEDTFSFSTLGFDELDLIICRNVFLYLHADAIGHVVEKMMGVLASHGYFLTGHGELPHQAVRTLQAKIFPDSVIYQRPHTLCAL